MTEDVRWKQRLQNFEKALALLEEPFTGDWQRRSDLEKQGAVQRFEFTFELAWKSLKDYLEWSGASFDQVTPRSVIKAGFAARILADGQVWIDMLDRRNLLAHTYEMSVFEEAVRAIAARYLPAIRELHTFLQDQART